MRRRLRRVVPPGVRRRDVRNGRDRGLHLHGLHPQGRRGERGRRSDDRGGGGGGERRGAVDVDVRRAESAVGIRRGHVVSHALSSKPSSFTSAAAAARASAGQLAVKQNCLGLRLNTVPHTMSIKLVSRLVSSQPVRLYSI